MQEYPDEVLLFIHRLQFLKTHEKLRILKICPTIKKCLELNQETLSGYLNRKVVAQWDSKKILHSVEYDQKILVNKKIMFYPFWDDQYPPLLKEINNPPFILFVRGRLWQQDIPCLTIVGTRKASTVIGEATVKLAQEISEIGIPIISGLALGIDSMAHKGAVKGRAHTFAVLGNAIDTVYPKQNARLAQNIIGEQGGLLSEYPPGTELRKHYFPERNRILAGVSRGVLLMEAPIKSGSLITIHEALKEGRDIFVYIQENYPLSEGIEYMLDHGAVPISSAADLLYQWGYPLPKPKAKNEQNSQSDDNENVQEKLIKRLYEQL